MAHIKTVNSSGGGSKPLTTIKIVQNDIVLREDLFKANRNTLLGSSTMTRSNNSFTITDNIGLSVPFRFQENGNTGQEYSLLYDYTSYLYTLGYRYITIIGNIDITISNTVSSERRTIYYRSITADYESDIEGSNVKLCEPSNTDQLTYNYTFNKTCPLAIGWYETPMVTMSCSSDTSKRLNSITATFHDLIFKYSKELRG